jgi:regulatory protein
MRPIPEPPEPSVVRDPHEVPDADPESVARAIILRQLTMAARTRQQLRETLRKRDVPPEVAERMLDRMEAVGLVDDAAFARDYVEQRRASRGSGRRALGMELGRKGVSAELIESTLASIEPEDETALAQDLVRRKWRSVSGLTPDARRRRLAGMLGRRGYAPALCFEAIRVVEQEQGDASMEAVADQEVDAVGSDMAGADSDGFVGGNA